MNGLISIIVPVYNTENTLERCVRSLREQTYSDIEILLVNDGSKDGSLAVCRRFAQEDSRVRVIDKPNGGVSSARNAGLDAARGDYVMFCDSDDWVDPDWCSVMLRCSQPDGLTVCGIVREDIPCPENKQEETLSMEQTERKDFLHYPLVMCSPVNKIFSCAVIEKNRLRFSEKLSLGEDFAFVLSYLCAVKGKVCFLNWRLYFYDVSSEGSLSKRAPSPEQCESVFQKITSAMDSLGALDSQSLEARDRLVMPQLEHFLISTARRKDISFREKMSIAGDVGKLESFRSCSGRVIEWGNPIYLWIWRKKYVKLILLYLILQSVRT